MGDGEHRVVGRKGPAHAGVPHRARAQPYPGEPSSDLRNMLRWEADENEVAHGVRSPATMRRFGVGRKWEGEARCAVRPQQSSGGVGGHRSFGVSAALVNASPSLGSNLAPAPGPGQSRETRETSMRRPNSTPLSPLRSQSLTRVAHSAAVIRSFFMTALVATQTEPSARCCLLGGYERGTKRGETHQEN